METIKFNGRKDYNKLNLLPFNRKTEVRQDLVKKMNEYGFIQPINLIKTDLLDGKQQIYIADGQNRAMAAHFLDIPFYGVLVNIKFKSIEEIVKYVASLNSTQNKWGVYDYAKSYAYLGKRDYITLLNITEHSPYKISTMSSLLTGFRARGKSTGAVKEGTFKVYLLEETKDTLRFVAKLSKYGEVTVRMVYGIHYVKSLPRFDENKFIQRYQKNYEKFKEWDLNDYSNLFSSWLKQ